MVHSESTILAWKEAASRWRRIQFTQRGTSLGVHNLDRSALPFVIICSLKILMHLSLCPLQLEAPLDLDTEIPDHAGFPLYAPSFTVRLIFFFHAQNKII